MINFHCNQDSYELSACQNSCKFYSKNKKKKLLFELTINLGRSVNHCVCCMCVLDLCHTILLAVKGSFRPIKRQKS